MRGEEERVKGRGAVSQLLPNHAACLSLDVLLSPAGVHPGSLTPEVAENIMARAGRSGYCPTRLTWIQCKGVAIRRPICKTDFPDQEVSA